MTIDIRSSALLVTLRISSWSARKYDKKVTDKVTREHGASSDAGRFNKSLLPGDCASYKALVSYLGSIRQSHYDHTLAWGEDGGARLLPVANDRAYRDAYDEWTNQVNNVLLPAFLGEYPSLKEQARRLLNGMFKEEDYPTVGELERKFSLRAEFEPIPEANFRKIAVASGLQSEMERKLEERVQNSIKGAMDDAWNRLHECVEHLHERLAQPGAIFRDSLVENLRECCDMLGRLNVTGDQQLENARKASIERLLQFSPDRLRANDRARGNVATAAAEIMTQIRGARRVIRAPQNIAA